MKIHISLSDSKQVFNFTILGTQGSVLANTVRSAKSQSRLAWARATLPAGKTIRYYQSKGNQVPDTKITLVCTAASDEKIKELQTVIHTGVAEEGKQMIMERQLLSTLARINTELK